MALGKGRPLSEPPSKEELMTCLIKCDMDPRVCKASNATEMLRAALRLDIRADKPRVHFAGAWMAQIYNSTALVNMMVTKFGHDMYATAASVIHGAVWQVLFELSVEDDKMTLEHFWETGYRLCVVGDSPSFELQWVCAHAVGHGAGYYAATRQMEVAVEPACRKRTKIDTDARVTLAEIICDFYSDRGLAYSCAEGVWMTWRDMFDVQDAAKNFTQTCGDIKYGAMCVYHLAFIGGKDWCRMDVDDYCPSTLGTRWRHQCIFGLAAAGGRNVHLCDESMGIQLCEGLGDMALTDTCLHGTTYGHISWMAESTITIPQRNPWCRNHCARRQRSHDPIVRGLPCSALTICQDKRTWVSAGFLFRIEFLDFADSDV